MVYQGSKTKIVKDIIPILQSYVDNPNCKGYFEPFVGGCNVIDKIKCDHKYGSDIHPYLIALLQKVQNDIEDIPLHISEEEYLNVRDNKNNYPDWYVGLVGFCATYGTRYFGGYGRSTKPDGTPRDIPNERIRNLLKQAPNLAGIKFSCKNYFDTNTNIKNFVIYCDPPYKDTTKYNVETFDYERFYDWCVMMAKNNIVFISEYNMPQDKFECIWSKKVITPMGLNVENTERTEKLFKAKERL
jgi:site-specific DNA-adenine methylase